MSLMGPIPAPTSRVLTDGRASHHWHNLDNCQFKLKGHKHKAEGTQVHWWTYIFVQQILGKSFWVVWPPFRPSSETNDTSFEIPNMKLLESGKHWAWHHPEGGHAFLTKKVLLSLELVKSLSWQRFFQFQYCFQTARYRAFFWGI